MLAAQKVVVEMGMAVVENSLAPGEILIVVHDEVNTSMVDILVQAPYDTFWVHKVLGKGHKDRKEVDMVVDNMAADNMEADTAVDSMENILENKDCSMDMVTALAFLKNHIHFRIHVIQM